jgi:2-polyprenyl-6-methoxyphenol hydroxylase-like FAD-dependent oxidoreductase
MYPFGSNGASQAILDARVLAYELGTAGNVDAALKAYEDARRPVTAEVQTANRRQAGDVMARVSELARGGAHGNAAEELKAVEAKYKRVAGFDVETLNTRPSWSVVSRAQDADVQSLRGR